MPIKLFTGTPGAGKTLSALAAVCQELGVRISGRSADEIAADLKAQTKRPVVVCGIEGIRPGVFIEMEDARTWQDYEDGTLFVVDEAWKWFGSHDVSNRNDERILKLAEHRHRGFDFILTAQMPSQLNSTVRALVGSHVHVMRKFGTAIAMRYEWPMLVDDPNSTGKRAQAIESQWQHPASLYEVYQSATQHTIKRSLPWRVIAIPLVGVAVLGLLWLGISSITSLGSNGTQGAAAAGATAPAAATSVETGGERGQRIITDPAQYLAHFRPVVDSMPWSSPAAQAGELAAVPRLFCMSSDRRCGCVTEQGTAYRLDEAVCRSIARWGQYEPLYKAEPVSGQGYSAPGDAAGPPRAANGTAGKARIGEAYTGIPVTMAPGA